MTEQIDRLPGLVTVPQSLTSAAADVSALLTARGWVEVHTSVRATLWALPRTDAELYVPHSLKRNTMEWAGVMERMAAPAQQKPGDVERAIAEANFDVLRFRVNAMGQSIPLSSAAAVVGSAFGMVRAAATSARRLRRSIDGNYSKLGDVVARRAELAHTESGSFIFPVMLHIDPPEPAPQGVLPFVEEVIPESDERRVTRTLAQTLASFHKNIVEPGHTPNKANMLPVVYAGGTHELFAKMANALSDPEVAFLDTSFGWAGIEPVREGLPQQVVIPAEATSLVETAARVLSETADDPLRVLAGPIIRIEHEPRDPFGEVVIQAAPSAAGTRRSRVEVRVREEQLERLHHWMNTGTIVVVHGRVDRRPGHYAQLAGIGSPRPLDGALFDGGDSGPWSV